jgi:hypothetical protein
MPGCQNTHIDQLGNPKSGTHGQCVQQYTWNGQAYLATQPEHTNDHHSHGNSQHMPAYKSQEAA